MTVTHQLRLSALALLAVVALIAALMIYFDRERWQEARAEAFDEILVEQATLIVQLRDLSAAERVSAIGERVAAGDSAANTNRILALFDAEWEAIAGHRWISLADPAANGTGSLLYEIRLDDDTAREAFGVVHDLGDGQRLFVGRWTGPYRARIYETWRTLIIGGIAAAIPLVLLAVFSQRRTNRELTRLSAVCEAVGSGDLDARLPADPSSSELAIVGRYLNRTFARLQDLVAGLGQLTDSIQHEVAHGITRIDTRLGKLGSILESGEGDADRCIEDIKTECDAIAASATAMLALSEIKAGDTFAPVRVDLAACVSDVLDTLSILAEEKRIGVRSDLGAAPVLGDPRLLQVMVSNLVSNAIKYTPESGSITVTVAHDGPRVQLSVEDSGPGISVEDRDDVFVPRRRLTRDRETPGHGYGLAIAKAVAERHDGTIRIEDSDRGGRFVVRFPSVG